LGTDTVLCPGESILLTAPTTAFDILWQDGSNQTTIIADQPITYTLLLSNDCGTVSDELLLSFDTIVPAVDLGPDLEWCEGDVFTLNATQPFAADYLWSNGSTSPSVQITTPGIYSVDVSTICSAASQDVEITPGTDCKTSEVHADIYIPNVFSPNGDGINDVFMVSFGQDFEVTGMTGSIFDRWGNLLFSSKAIPFTWDGYFNDKAVMQGVYVYTINVKYTDQGTERDVSFAGDVTLVR
jgi:gliding motility-associated-like protein